MTSDSSKSIVHGDVSTSSRKKTDAREMLLLQRERLHLFARDDECPTPMLPHIMGASKRSIEKYHEKKNDKIENVMLKVKK
ncbi:hypothetical protein BDP55DRAFT_667496 [Colletotrichum godetiae]|uniref:Uncharacterized protein n=1 Tax=Colletotrichum godetiae TaxID=1209918 RepID=A0AAJ0ESX2_9PEZI|nr:uncharacterized protein BDP55DRAFT_667496 [Colletotrichum godetiae]KAK1674377.1 hypothetical protein BDP55DRAFT_667496 [Colletotrichum godetiae]